MNHINILDYAEHFQGINGSWEQGCNKHWSMTYIHTYPQLFLVCGPLSNVGFTQDHSNNINNCNHRTANFLQGLKQNLILVKCTKQVIRRKTYLQKMYALRYQEDGVWWIGVTMLGGKASPVTSTIT